MRNILRNVTPRDLHGRLKYSTQYASESYLKGKRILDIGCGFGWFLVHGLNAGASIVAGIEQTDNDLSVALDDAQLSQSAVLKVGSGLSIPFDDGSFDVVTAWEVLEHIPKGTENQFFAEINRVISPEGILFISTPCHNWLSTYADPAFWLLGHRHYKISEIASFAMDNGFVVEDIKVRGGHYELLALYNLYVSKWIFRRSPFYEQWQNGVMDIEWSRDSGYMTILSRLKKRR